MYRHWRIGLFLFEITGSYINSSISAGECFRGEGTGRRGCWELRQTSSIPELCAHIFVSLSSRVSLADATAWRKGSLLFILSLSSALSLSLGFCSRGLCLFKRTLRFLLLKAFAFFVWGGGVFETQILEINNCIGALWLYEECLSLP